MKRMLTYATLLWMQVGMAAAGEVPSNGIVLPDQWPPRRTAELTRDPLATPPYLVSPPAVIPIDVGRQLFVDVVGDKLYFYVGAASGRITPPHADPANVGLAILRRDGFASMDAGQEEGRLTTRKLKFSGKHLFVNVDAPQGRLIAEVLDAGGKAVAPFTRENCMPVSADTTIQEVKWKGADDLSALAGKPVRFRFHLLQGKLYAFWVSAHASGASRGCVAAGGPGFTGTTDTVGVAGYPKTARSTAILAVP